jgi:hypothetical protein
MVTAVGSNLIGKFGVTSCYFGSKRTEAITSIFFVSCSVALAHDLRLLCMCAGAAITGDSEKTLRRNLTL